MWQTIIGLEVHVQLATQSKLFSSASTLYGAPSNTETHYLDAGLPGTLPVFNHKALELAICFGLAINAEIVDYSFFERKNYFYPDLPKGYQISQLQRPIIRNGFLTISTEKGEKQIIIERAHLEEDAGKSVHAMHGAYTGIDLNRAGIPLLEIVTTPCLTNATEAVQYLKNLHQLVRFLGISDGNMQEGSFRCDVNISIKKTTDDKLGTRVELKNLNSFKFIEKAILFEEQRQRKLLENGEIIRQETRLYDANLDKTIHMRDKEKEADYRYFPDPDLLPIQITPELLNEVKRTMRSTPQQLTQKLSQVECLTQEDIDFLLTSPAHFEYFEKAMLSSTQTKLILNWLKGPFSAALNQHQLSIEHAPITSEQFSQFVLTIEKNELSQHMAKKLFEELWKGEHDISEILATLQQDALSPKDIEIIVQQVLSQHPQQVEDYRKGKEKLWTFFVGQIMRHTKGKANPELVNEFLKKHL